MDSTPEIIADEIILTESAARKVQELLAQKNLEGYSLRVFISGGGCSGYQYGMALDNRVLETDHIFEGYGVKVLVDEISFDYLNGSTVDFIEGETAAGFKISNPNSMPSCGCGDSSCGSSSKGCC